MQVSTAWVSADWGTFRRFFEFCALSYHWSSRICPFLCSGGWAVSAAAQGLGKFPVSLFESDGCSATMKHWRSICIATHWFIANYYTSFVSASTNWNPLLYSPLDFNDWAQTQTCTRWWDHWQNSISFLWDERAGRDWHWLPWKVRDRSCWSAAI